MVKAMLYLATSVSIEVQGVPVASEAADVVMLVEIVVLTVDVDEELEADDAVVLLAIALVSVHSKQLAS